MFYGSSVEQTRQMFYNSWKKHLTHQPLTGLEKEICSVIVDHPEYHNLLASSSISHNQYFPELGETNPFLHMGLHLAVRDQIKLDKPAGILNIYQHLLKTVPSHQIEHLFMEKLAECLWAAQKEGTIPDGNTYLASLDALKAST